MIQNLQVEHDLAHEHVLESSEGFGTVYGIITLKGLVEV